MKKEIEAKRNRARIMARQTITEVKGLGPGPK